MNYFTFQPEGVTECTVTAMLHTTWQSFEMKDRKIPAVIICPGGGYDMVSHREGEPVANQYYSAGYHVFILQYCVKEKARNFRPLCQLAATIAQVRKYANEWRVDEKKIAVCGFSAGGHLAGSLGTIANTERFQRVWARDDDIAPNALILGYPVIRSDEMTHRGTIQNVSGSQPGTEEYKWFGLDRHVSEKTPPTFLWHTADDDCVPVENSIRFGAELSKNKIPFELHILPHGWHGMSVCTEEVNADDPYNGRWMQWSIEWLKKIFK